jgi:hypothetical protein
MNTGSTSRKAKALKKNAPPALIIVFIKAEKN